MSKNACKCKEVECEECPEWIFTLADLIMCMMGLFVIMWVLKPTGGKGNATEGDEEWIKTVAAIREAFKYEPNPDSNDPVDIKMREKKLAHMRPRKGPGDGGKQDAPQKGPDGENQQNQTIRLGKQSSIGGHILFDVGGVALSPEAKHNLDQIVDLIKGNRIVVLIKGNAGMDDFPEGTDPEEFMKLSVQRAQVVDDYLVAQGVSHDSLWVVGCSTFAPVTKRAYTAEARQANRRVEVETTATLVPDLQDSAATVKPLETTPPDESSKKTSEE